MRILFAFIFVVCLSACETDDNRRRNPNLLNINVNYEISLNLPQYNNLNFVGNAVYIPNQGNLGIIVVNSGSGFYAWDAADPNLPPSDCSRLVIDGLEAASSCNPPNTYSLIDGLPIADNDNEEELRYGMMSYRVTESGNILRIFN